MDVGAFKQIDALTAYVLVVALLTMLLLVLLWQRQRSEKTVSVWMAASLIGVVLGSIGSFAAAHLAGYQVVEKPKLDPNIVDEVDPGEAGGMGGMAGGMGGMGGGMGGGMAGGMGGMGGGMGGRGPAPKRDLTTVIRKLELLTGTIQIELSEEQRGKLAKILAVLDEQETLTDEQAKTHHEAILALIDDGQQTRMDAIGLPRSSGRSGGSGGGRRGGRSGGSPGGGQAGRGGPGGSPGGGQAGRGGGRPEADANPLADGRSAEALDKLLRRVTSDSPADADTTEQPADKAPKPDAVKRQPTDASEAADASPAAKPGG